MTLDYFEAYSTHYKVLWVIYITITPQVQGTNRDVKSAARKKIFGEGGVIRLGTRREENPPTLVLEIGDTGLGMTEAVPVKQAQKIGLSFG